MKPDKLIAEYQKKIFPIDIRIDQINEEIRKIRMENTVSDYLNKSSYLVGERKTIDVRRQCYIQFIEDLKDLK